MTPTQLRAFACVVRLGSVKAAAKELAVSEAAVSMHVAQLRKEFDDLLFTRASSGLAFTPGGLRLASRAVEILGLQDRTVREVSQAGDGRRVLRLACTSLFAEHAAPGLIDLFAARADDLEVELSVRPVEQLAEPVAGAFGRRGGRDPVGPPRDDVAATSFLRYEVVVAARPGHPLAGHPVGGADVRRVMWALGPAAVGTTGVMPTVLRRLGRPREAPAHLPEPGGRDRGDEGVRRRDPRRAVRDRCGRRRPAAVDPRRPGTACPGLAGRRWRCRRTARSRSPRS